MGSAAGDGVDGGDPERLVTGLAPEETLEEPGIEARDGRPAGEPWPRGDRREEAAADVRIDVAIEEARRERRAGELERVERGVRPSLVDPAPSSVLVELGEGQPVVPGGAKEEGAQRVERVGGVPGIGIETRPPGHVGDESHRIAVEGEPEDTLPPVPGLGVDQVEHGVGPSIGPR